MDAGYSWSYDRGLLGPHWLWALRNIVKNEFREQISFGCLVGGKRVLFRWGERSQGFINLINVWGLVLRLAHEMKNLSEYTVRIPSPGQNQEILNILQVGVLSMSPGSWVKLGESRRWLRKVMSWFSFLSWDLYQQSVEVYVCVHPLSTSSVSLLHTTPGVFQKQSWHKNLISCMREEGSPGKDSSPWIP